MVPKPHLGGISNLNLIATHLPLIDFLAAHLHSRIALGKFEAQAQLEIAQFTAPPDEPILFGLATGEGFSNA